MKQCKACGKLLPMSDFRLVGKAGQWYAGRCKRCYVKYEQLRQRPGWKPKARVCKHCGKPRKVNERSCASCLNGLRRDWAKKNKDKIRGYSLKHRYSKISLDGYEKLLVKQRGVCAICSASPNGRALAVDHNHNTAMVRGLLCDKCNLGLGLFGDSPERLLAATSYLKSFPI